MTQQNAPVLKEHRDEAAKAAGYRDWAHANPIAPSTTYASIEHHAQALANLEAVRTENADLRGQIDKLAHFIMANVPGEPSRSEGAIDCAIRVIEALNNRLAEIDRIAVEHGFDRASAGSFLRNILDLASGHTPSPCPGCAEKDEAMAELRADLVEIDRLCIRSNWCAQGKSVTAPNLIAAIAAKYRPPADPVADALKAALTGANLLTDSELVEHFAEVFAEHGLEIAELKSRGCA